MGNRASCTRLITRGNLDGIACAAVFLDRFPESAISFITSPPQAVAEAAEDRTSDLVYIADVPLTDQLASHLANDGRTCLVDHHPTRCSSPRALIDPRRSAAGTLHDHLGSSPRTYHAAVLADLYERADSVLLSDAVLRFGRHRLAHETMVLDFAWRYNVEDDAFRWSAAASLATGLWPSESEAIALRYASVMQGQRWWRAVQRAGDRLEVRGGLAVLDLRYERLSLQGFGSMALVEAGRARGCRYALLVHDSRGSSIASLRSCGGTSINLGRFAERFTQEHGLEGGGHPSSAGARVPRQAADLLIEDLAAAC
jgi:hypothetical protein